VHAPSSGRSWLALTDQPLPVGAAYDWCVDPSCGAIVLFSGTVRDHAPDAHGSIRADVQTLTYEAYAEQVLPRFEAIDAEVRRRWPTVERVLLWHRTGTLQLTESSVIACVSAPHRPQAFEAARFAIDALKATAPIWKLEQWADGTSWGTGAQQPVDAVDVVG
jgi:molybdopterin synthase catalytic subunit